MNDEPYCDCPQCLVLRRYDAIVARVMEGHGPTCPCPSCRSEWARALERMKPIYQRISQHPRYLEKYPALITMLRECHWTNDEVVSLSLAFLDAEV